MNLNNFKNFFENKAVLVTGGAGFIGSHIVQELFKLKAKITVLDNLSTGNLDNIKSLLPQINFINSSITDYNTCLDITKNQKIIYHLAAQVSVAQSIAEPDLCHNTNILGTYNLLEAARTNKIESFIFSSSAAVYGNNNNICSEDTQTNPLSTYAYSKLIGEILCKQYSSIYNLNTVILRYFNVFGDRQNPHGPYASALAKFRYCFEKNLPITIFGNGLQKRDFVSVNKIVEANLILSTKTNKYSGEIFNIATGKSISILEVLENLKAEFIDYKQNITFLPARSGDILNSQANCIKYNNLFL